MPKTARIVWTYFDLGLDMGGRPDAQRRELLKRLQAYLAWPSGTIAFVPMSELAIQSDELVARPDMFWQIVHGLDIRTIACFGQRAFRAICPRAGKGSIHFTRDDYTVHILQGPNILVNMRETDQQAGVERLREAVL